MKKYLTLGIFAHANAGKTTVTENILHNIGLIEKIGRVDNGDTITDSLAVEKNRGITVRSSYVSFKLNDKVVQLLDTPGHIDFSGEVVRAMNVLDAAIFVISGVKGIEAQTTAIWKMLSRVRVPIIFFINKLDRFGSNYNRVVEEMKNKFSDNLISLQDITKNDREIEITNKSSYEILEKLSEFDEKSLEKFVNNETDKQWINKRIKDLYFSNDIMCVVGGSALNRRGIENLLDCIDLYLPIFESKDNDEFGGYVYMIKRQNGIKETFIKVLSGRLNNRLSIDIFGEQQKIKTMMKIHGNELIKSDIAYAGEIIAVTGLECKVGDIIGYSKEIYFQDIKIYPMFTAYIEPKSELDRIALAESVKQLNEEDPILNARTKGGKIQIDLMGKLQGEIIVALLNDRYDISVIMSEPSVIYRETPIKDGVGKAGYTKTSNIMFKIEALDRNEGIKYESAISTDFLFIKYQKQVERLVKHYIKKGLYGWEVTDVKISLIDGKCDNVGSEPLDYNIAVPIALMRGLKECHTKLLEPVVAYNIKIPKNYLQNVISELTSFQKPYENLEEESNNFIISGNTCLSNIIMFTRKIYEISEGRGSVNYHHIGYEEVNSSEIIMNDYGELDPRNEIEFILKMDGSKANLDKGLNIKRGKPQIIKKNKRLWKNIKK